MARRCGPNKQKCGMSQGIYNPFFQNGAYWYGSSGVDAGYQAILNKTTSLGGSLPAALAKALDNAMYIALKPHLPEMDVFRWEASDVGGAYDRVNWVNPNTHTAVHNGGLTKTANEGYNTDGTTGYIDWAYNPSTQGVKYLRDNSSVSVHFYSTTNVPTTFVTVGNDDQVFIGELTNNMLGRIQTAVGMNFGASPTDFKSSKTYTVRRTASNVDQTLVDGVVVQTAANVSNAIANANIYSFRRNSVSTLYCSAGIVISAVWAGSSAIDNAAVHQIVKDRILAGIVLGAHYAGVTQTQVSLSGRSTIIATGDSFTQGLNASPASEAYIPQFRVTHPGLTTLNNISISGRGVWSQASSIQGNGATKSSTLLTALIGLNDIRRGGASAKTLAKIEACYRALIFKGIYNASTPSGHATVTRTGTIIGHPASTNGGLFGSGTLPGNFASQSSAGGVDTWEWTFTGTEFGIQFIGSDGVAEVYGTANIYIDNVLVASKSLNNLADGISDGVNNNQHTPVAYTFHGLSSGSHTIRVESGGDGIVPIDFFATLHPAANSYAFLFAEIPYLTAYGYIATPGLDQASIAESDTASDIIKGIVDEYRALGYAIAFVKTNTYYNRYIGCDSDNVHANNIGHDEIEAAFNAAVS